ncbi:MAG TPA: cytochrome P450 [Pyrinomonadaceae bacterium]|nr:cytochrome P450 [Pyrinomonadaceae bacterium]
MSTLIEDARSGLAPFDPFHPDFLEDPYRFYATYREADPVHWGLPPEPMAPGCWYIMRHDDARFALDDPRFCVEIASAIPPEFLPPIPEAFRPFFEQTGDWFLFRDPPDHTRLRRLVSGALTRRQVEQLEPRIRQVANDLLDRAGDAQQLDAIGDYAASLPVIIIADLLGMPLDNREQLHRWSKAILAGMNLRQSEEAPRLLAEATTAVQEFSAHLRQLFAEKRSRPDEHLMSRLINVADAGDQLSDRELVATCIMLFFAGHETTVNLLGNGLLALLKNPDQLALLRQRPELINSAVEEMARYDSSGQMTFRFATEDVELRGKRIGRGEPIAVVMGAANRDPNVFPDPDKFDITRQDNPHIAFGSGRHHCLGASLARMEARISITALLERMPEIRLLREKQEWNRSIGLRGLATLPVGSSAAVRSSAAS